MRYIRALRRIEQYPGTLGAIGLLFSIGAIWQEVTAPPVVPVLLIIALALFYVCALILLQVANYHAYLWQYARRNDMPYAKVRRYALRQRGLLKARSLRSP